MDELELQVSFTISTSLIDRVETNLAETWEGIDYEERPTFMDVFNEALTRVAQDIRDELADQVRCQKVDTCQAQAMVKRALADELIGSGS